MYLSNSPFSLRLMLILVLVYKVECQADITFLSHIIHQCRTQLSAVALQNRKVDNILEALDDLQSQVQEISDYIKLSEEKTLHSCVPLSNEETTSKIELTTEMVEEEQKNQDTEKAVAIKAHQIDKQECLAKHPEIQRIHGTHIINVEQLGKLFVFDQRTGNTWSDAKKDCETNGLHLVTLKSFSQIQHLTTALANRGIGAYDLWVSATERAPKTRQFYWADGTQVNKDLWHYGKPDNSDRGNETCVSLNSIFGTLFENICLQVISYLCEIPPPLSTCMLKFVKP